MDGHGQHDGPGFAFIPPAAGKFAPQFCQRASGRPGRSRWDRDFFFQFGYGQIETPQQSSGDR
jgi:hypothetical protein